MRARNYYFRAVSLHRNFLARERFLELPTSHTVPFTWLFQHGNETIKLRAAQDFASPGQVSQETLDGLGDAILHAKSTQAIAKRQKDNGTWGGNMLALAPSAKDGVKEIGTIPQHRRLVQIGLPRGTRPFKLSERVLFRLLSRDDDPALLFEHAKFAKEGPLAIEWVRDHFREAATAALAEAGYQEDPRIRGAAHKIASAVSAFLRSPLAEKPFTRVASKTILDPEAHPPSWYSVAMIAAMPNIQRERAGFTERLGQYLALPAPKKEFALMVGKKTFKSDHLILGDPIEADSKGNAKDIPLALYTIELLARLGALHTSAVATRVLARLLSECDDNGIWQPKALKSAPKPVHKITYHWYPLHPETKQPESKVIDVTYRLAQISKILGHSLQIV